ncbi:MAG: YciI family protein [Pirellula sp.]|nr:YciI family protein [Pirellula sp.]
MKFMLLIYSQESCWNESEMEACISDSMKICEELAVQGKYIDASPLESVSTATSVQIRNGKRILMDGPFAETHEQLGGYYIIDVPNLDDAISIASRLPPATKGTVEIRPIVDLGDMPNGKDSKPVMDKRPVTPYLFFGGRCEEAIRYYSEHLDGNLQMMMRFSESPDPVPAGMLQSGFENKVMHASMLVADTPLMLSDGCDDKTSFRGFRLAISARDEKTAHRYFNALADGGTVEMPLTKTFWSPCYGMVTDRFGVGWMVMVIED